MKELHKVLLLQMRLIGWKEYKRILRIAIRRDSIAVK